MKKILLSALLLSFNYASADEVKLPQKENFQLFLLAGQSNMSGRGKLDDAAKKPIPRIFALNKELEWQAAVDPLHWDKSAAGIGIGRSFATIIAEKNPQDSIGLIPAACGGSPISTWTPGAFHDQTKSHPYDDAIKRAKIAMNTGTLKAVLWHQGESDSNPKNAPLYEKRLEELINRFRKDLGQPELPFIIGQLGDFPGKPTNLDRDIVNAASRAIAKKINHVSFVTSERLASNDGLHFDKHSLRILGQRYADAYHNLLIGGSNLKGEK